MLLQQFKAYWKEYFPQLSTTNCRLLVAVSGGIDSVVLTDLLYQSGFRFVIAHCNFRLRDEESERDEAFVKDLAKRYGTEIIVQKFNTQDYTAQHRLSIQEAARKLRYDWFTEIVDSWRGEKENGGQLTVDKSGKTAADPPPAARNQQYATSNYIVTAHHANDSIETLLINFFRGTGISGLHGILPKQGNVIRPLLFATRERIRQYALENNIQWVEDSSNASDKYTRNFFRLHILPAVREIYPNADDNLLQNIQRFGEAEILYHHAINLYKKKLVEVKGNEVHIPVLKLQKSEPLHTIIWEIAKDFNFTVMQVNDIKKLLTAENGKYVASQTHRIIRNRAWLIIAPVPSTKTAHILIEENDKHVVYEGGELSFKMLSIANYQLPASLTVATLDAAYIQYPLLLRKWKQGDYFYPLGMKKKKKLSKFFIDLKLSTTEKERVWVLEMDKKIFWVIGYRIDDRFKITPATKDILVIMKM